MYFVHLCLGVLLFQFYFLEQAVCEDGYYFLKSAKNIPRIGRAIKNSDEEKLEKFLLKFSKSVPRIGRRGSLDDDDGKFSGYNIKYPVYAEIPENYDHYPDAFAYSQRE